MCYLRAGCQRVGRHQGGANAIRIVGVAQHVLQSIKKMPSRRTRSKSRDPRLQRAGVTRYNVPKRTPRHPTKSHIVVAKVGNRVKTIRFGQQGVHGSPYRRGESERSRARRRSFLARHARNIQKGKMSAAYWAKVTKW